MKVKTGSFTGNGTDNRAITGIGFEPHVLIVKRKDSGNNAFYRQSGMASGNSMTLRGDSGLETGKIKSLDSDGFTLGTADEVNGNTATYTYIAIKDDGAGDFKYGSYTGNGSDNRSLTGIGFSANWLVIKGDGGRTGAYRSNTLTGDKTHPFYFSGTNSDQIQSIDSDGFQLGTSDFVNANSRTYYYFAFKEVSDFCEVFTYTGNGSDNRDVTTPGFQPGFVWIKQEDNSDPRFRTTGHSGDNSQSFDGTQEANSIQAFISTGFTVGNNSQVNDNTKTYHVLALKEGTSASSNATPTVLSSTLAVLAPIVTGAALLTAGLLSGTLALQLPLARGAAQTAPAAISETIAVQSPVVAGSAQTAPSIIPSSFAIHAPTAAGGDTNVPVSPATSSLTIQNPIIAGGATASAGVQAIGITIQNPIVQIPASCSPSAINSSLSILPPTIAGGAQTTVSPINGTLTLPAVVITGAATIALESSNGSLSVLIPEVSAGASSNPESTPGNLTVLSPALSIGATISPPPLNVTLQIQNPSLRVSALLYPSSATANFSVYPPIVAGAGRANPTAFNTSITVLPVTVTYRRIYPYSKKVSPFTKRASPYSSRNSPYMPLIRI